MTLPVRAQVWLGMFVVASLAQVSAEFFHRERLAGVAIVVLMPLLAAFMITARRGRDALLRWVLFALAFSWLGDTFGFFIVIKIMFFLIAQIAYIVAFWPYRRASALYQPGRLMAYGVLITTLIIIMARFAAGLGPAIVIYGLAIGLMAVLASGVNVATAVGGLVFIVSDALIAIDTFARPGYLPAAGFLIMCTYLTAQLLLVWGALRLNYPLVPGLRSTAGRRRLAS